MKRMLKALARLYPAAWRRRYGAEYEALLEDRTPRTRDAFDVLSGAVTTHVTSRSFVRIVLPCALVGGLAALAFSFKVPPVYTSRTEFTWTRNYIPGVAPPMATGAVVVTVGNPFPSHTGPYGDLIRAINYPDAVARGGVGITIDEHYMPYNDSLRDVFNPTYLAAVIHDCELYPRERARMPLDKVILKMQSAIIVRYSSRLTNARYNPLSSAQDLEQNFAVQFTYPDPKVSLKVNYELAFWLNNTMFLSHYAKSKPNWDSYPRFSYLPSSPPQRPDGLSRSAECGLGLLDGLFCGFVLATFRGPRQDTSVSS